jgi:hypothetical protein
MNPLHRWDGKGGGAYIIMRVTGWFRTNCGDQDRDDRKSLLPFMMHITKLIVRYLTMEASQPPGSQYRYQTNMVVAYGTMSPELIPCWKNPYGTSGLAGYLTTRILRISGGEAGWESAHPIIP